MPEEEEIDFAEKVISRGEFMDMMQRCRNEIMGLRAHIAHLEPKAEAYDSLAAVIRQLPRQTGGMSEDLVWRIDQRVNALVNPSSGVSGAAA